MNYRFSRYLCALCQAEYYAYCIQYACGPHIPKLSPFRDGQFQELQIIGWTEIPEWELLVAGLDEICIFDSGGIGVNAVLSNVRTHNSSQWQIKSK